MVILNTSTAARPEIIPKYINPRASSPPPNHKIIGNPSAEMVNVPKEAPIILAVVSFVLSSLSSVILAVKDEYGTLTMVKHVRCKRFAVNRKIKSSVPWNGGTQNRRIKESASGMAP